MASFRRFTSGDYMGYEGAARLPDGTAPLISTSTDGLVTYLITGPEEEEVEEYNFSAQIFNNAWEEEEWWFRRETDKDVARRIGSLLPDNGDRTTLLALGFTREW